MIFNRKLKNQLEATKLQITFLEQELADSRQREAEYQDMISRCCEHPGTEFCIGSWMPTGHMLYLTAKPPRSDRVHGRADAGEADE